MNRRDETTIALADVVCPRCEARPAERCRTLSGRPTHMHASRLNPLLEAWRNGYADGRDEGKRIAERTGLQG